MQKGNWWQSLEGKRRQIRNPKHEILNKFKILNFNVLNFVWNLGHWDLDIVSDLSERSKDYLVLCH
jgi:hypothetical protein